MHGVSDVLSSNSLGVFNSYLITNKRLTRYLIYFLKIIHDKYKFLNNFQIK